MLNLQGEEAKITVTDISGKQEEIISYVYYLPLIDSMGEIVHFRVYGIDRISTEIKAISIENVLHLFHDITGKSVRRPIGEIDVLVGFDMRAITQYMNNQWAICCYLAIGLVNV